MPELLQDFEHDTIPFPHAFTVWVLSFSFFIEWGSLWVKALEQDNECTNNQPTDARFAQCPFCAGPFEGTSDTTAGFAQPFRFTETPRGCLRPLGERAVGQQHPFPHILKT